MMGKVGHASVAKRMETMVNIELQIACVSLPCTVLLFGKQHRNFHHVHSLLFNCGSTFDLLCSRILIAQHMLRCLHKICQHKLSVPSLRAVGQGAKSSVRQDIGTLKDN
jgi:hypothetical protein